jgi:thioredoxin-dependent peroxiredoxin
MRLQSGLPITPFSTVDIHERPVNLATYQGQHVLLSFIRFAGCPFCNLRVYALTVRQPLHAAAGLATIAVVESTREHIMTQDLLRAAPFPVIADPAGRLYEQFGAQERRLGFWRTLKRRAAEITHAQQMGWDGLVDGKPMDNDGKLYRLPAEFLIGPDQRVMVAHYAKDIGDFMPLAIIDESLHLPAVSATP